MRYRRTWTSAILVLATLGLPCGADSLRRLETIYTYTRSRRLGFEVSHLPRASAAYGRPARGTLFIAGNPSVNDGTDKPVWQCTVPVFPTRVFLQEDGQYVLLLCTYAGTEASSRHALVVLGPNGKLLADLSLEEFQSKEDLRSAQQTVSYIDWDAGVHPEWERVEGKETLRLRLFSGRLLRMDLASGKYSLEPPLP